MEILLPNFDVNDLEAKITDIFVEEGEFVEKNLLIIKVENTKAIHEIYTKETGYIKLLCKKYDTVKKGEKIAIIFENRELYDHFIQTNEELEAQIENKEENKTIMVTDKAITLAAELNIDIELIKTKKKTGVVKTKDVQDFYENVLSVQSKTVKPFNKYDRERVMLIGAGKGAEIAIDILLDDYDKQIVGLVDSYANSFERYPYPLVNCNVEKFPHEFERSAYDSVLITFGSSLNTFQYRKQLFELYEKKQIQFCNAIERSCNFRRGVGVGKGNIICGNSYFGTETAIGDNNFISYGVNVGHHNFIGSHNLIAPGFTTAGFVTLGDGCIITTGVITRNKLSIGNNVVLPLGYVVMNDIEDGTIIQQNSK